MESIGDLAFYSCGALKKVVSLNPTPPSLMYSVFLYTDTLYVPYGKSYEYRQAKYWKEFKEIKELRLVYSFGELCGKNERGVVAEWAAEIAAVNEHRCGNLPGIIEKR